MITWQLINGLKKNSSQVFYNFSVMDKNATKKQKQKQKQNSQME